VSKGKEEEVAKPVEVVPEVAVGAAEPAAEGTAAPVEDKEKKDKKDKKDKKEG
jgi:hypothetical protein